MTDFSDLLGLTLEEASWILDQRMLPWVSRRYSAFRPLENTDTERVVRAREQEDGTIELIVCAFVSQAVSRRPDGKE